MGRIGSEHGRLRTDFFHLGKYFFLDADIFGRRLDHQVRTSKPGVIGCPGDIGYHGIRLIFFERLCFDSSAYLSLDASLS